MIKKELRKGNGDVFFEATRAAANSCIFVNWIGIQSIETIMMGGNTILNMLREQPCDTLINSNKELIGPWDDGAGFFATRWAPQAATYGLKRFFHVLSPGIFGRKSFQKFEALAQQFLKVTAFETEEEAKEML